MKYDAHASALDDAYGMLAELRRELSDTREDKNDREELLDLFATCKDSQRAWILLECGVSLPLTPADADRVYGLIHYQGL